MAEWRAGRGWTETEIADRVAALAGLPTSFEERQDEMTPERGWRPERSESVIAREAPGPPVPNGPFERAAVAVERYEHSDPTIVTGHFDPEASLLGRRMLLEIRVLGLHFLCGVVVGAVERLAEPERTTFGYRYDTLTGHLERGSEWFRVIKDHRSGEVRFQIASRWREGDFPNWWSRVGFAPLAPLYRRLWLSRAHRRLRAWARGALPRRTPIPTLTEAAMAFVLGLGSLWVLRRIMRARRP